VVARLAAKRGWAVVSLLPPPDLPAAGSTLSDWVSLVEKRVRAGRAAIRDFTSNDEHCVALLGVSAGGIAALRVAELEGRVDVVAGLLVGSGREGLAHAAAAYGAAPAPVDAALQARLDLLDPARHADALGERPVLLGRALFDEVIPEESFEILRHALGNVPTHIYPTGHETFVYALPPAIERTLGWVEEACSIRQRGSDGP
jgi:pimeloyl-ACP methyl ester carboxylesterase